MFRMEKGTLYILKCSSCVICRLYILQRLICLQGDDSSTESKQDKPKQDDPVVDLFPDDDTEERNSK